MKALTVKTSRGMTLVELMVVMVVIAVLAAVAVPSYRNYIIRANRTEAKTALLRIQAAEEKFYLQNSFYTAELAAAPPAGLGIGELSEDGNYSLAVVPHPDLLDQGFIATAVPAAGSGQERDGECARFTLNHAGARTGTPAGVEKCWR
jgi:type IV pilus assembly protein PilE